jgi:adenosyl cobinamide kinase/adenosyl cobinamide phosphate guanylyltransferase
MLTFLTGGARSGKSALAVRMGERHERVVFVATARPEGDEEWAERLARHRAERPASWVTLEESLDLVSALERVDPSAFVILDCLTLWVANALEAGWADDDVVGVAAKAADRAAVHPGGSVAVSNEVGGGIVPVDREVRRFRDVLGRVNATWAAAADRAWLVVAGRVLNLGDPDDSHA